MAKQNKYERCVMKVKAKQPPNCVKKRLWGKSIKGKKCYNPYAVCHASIKASIRIPKTHIGPRGGKYRLIKGIKFYIKK